MTKRNGRRWGDTTRDLMIEEHSASILLSTELTAEHLSMDVPSCNASVRKQLRHCSVTQMLRSFVMAL